MDLTTERWGLQREPLPCRVARRPRCGVLTAAAQKLHFVRGKGREGIRRGFLEAGETAAENEFHHVRRAIALLGDAQLGFFALFGSGASFEKKPR